MYVRSFSMEISGAQISPSPVSVQTLVRLTSDAPRPTTDDASRTQIPFSSAASTEYHVLPTLMTLGSAPALSLKFAGGNGCNSGATGSLGKAPNPGSYSSNQQGISECKERK